MPKVVAWDNANTVLYIRSLIPALTRLKPGHQWLSSFLGSGGGGLGGGGLTSCSFTLLAGIHSPAVVRQKFLLFYSRQLRALLSF